MQRTFNQLEGDDNKLEAVIRRERDRVRFQESVDLTREAAEDDPLWTDFIHCCVCWMDRG